MEMFLLWDYISFIVQYEHCNVVFTAGSNIGRGCCGGCVSKVAEDISRSTWSIDSEGILLLLYVDVKVTYMPVDVK